MRNRIFGAVLIVMAVVAFFSLSHLVGLDTPREGSLMHSTQAKLDSRLAVAAGLFASTKAACGLLSFLQDVEVELRLVVAGANVNPLTVLTPLATTLNKLSDLFLLATAAIMLQKILLIAGGWLSLKVLLPLAFVITGISLWLKNDMAKKLRRLALTFSAVAMVALFTIPLSVGLGDGIENYFLGDMVKKVETGLSEGTVAIEELQGKLIAPESASEQDFLSRAKDILSFEKIKERLSGSLNKAVDKIKEVSGQLVNILIAMFASSILLPVGTLIGLWLIIKPLMRLTQ